MARSGVPLYLLFKGDGTDAIILPEILTETMVLNALRKIMKKLIILLFLVSLNVSAFNINDINFINSEGKEVDLSQIDSEIIFEWSNLECPYVKRHYGSNNMQTTQKFAKSKNVIWITVISSAEGKQGIYSTKRCSEYFCIFWKFS